MSCIVIESWCLVAFPSHLHRSRPWRVYSHLWLTSSFCRFKMALEFTVSGSNSHLAACVKAKHKREERVHSIRLYIAYQRHVLYTEWNMGRPPYNHLGLSLIPPTSHQSLWSPPSSSSNYFQQQHWHRNCSLRSRFAHISLVAWRISPLHNLTSLCHLSRPFLEESRNHLH